MIVKYKSFNYSVDTYDFYAGIILIIFISFIFLFLFVLIIYQTCFISKNITTREYVKNKFVAGNPFDKGITNNFSSFFKDIDDYKRIIDYNDAARGYNMELVFVEKPTGQLIGHNDSQIALTDVSVTDIA